MIQGTELEHTPTWRIIPGSQWLITMVGTSPKDRVVGPLPNGRTSWLIKMGVTVTNVLTVDGSEIRRSPVCMVNIPRFNTSQVDNRISEPSTIGGWSPNLWDFRDPLW